MTPKKSQWLSILFIIFSIFIIIGLNLNNVDGEKGVQAEQQKSENLLLQLESLPLQQVNQTFQIQLIYSRKLTEEIKLKVPEGLEYQPLPEKQDDSNYIVNFDYTTREVTIVPTSENEATQESSQTIALDFKATAATNYSLQAVTSDEQTTIVSNSLQLTVEANEPAQDESNSENEADNQEGEAPTPPDTETAEKAATEDLDNQLDLNLNTRSLYNARSIETNKPEDRLIIKEKFRDPIGSGAKFIDPTILQMSDAKSQLGSIWSKKQIGLKEKLCTQVLCLSRRFKSQCRRWNYIYLAK